MKTFSIIVETENLGMAGLADLRNCLDCLANGDFDVNKANEVFVVVGGRLSDESSETIRKNYPWVTIHRAGNELSYTQAKRHGAEICSGDIVVYADSDMSYKPTWLRKMLEPFSVKPDAGVVCSDTRIDVTSAYRLGLQIAWIIPVRPFERGVKPASSFMLNNFAIRRDLMLDVPFDEDVLLYRGRLGYWKKRLAASGVTIYRVPEVLGFHLPPQGFKEWWYRMLIYGADFVSSGDYRIVRTGSAVRVVKDPSFVRRLGNACKWMAWRIFEAVQRLWRLVAERPAILWYVPGGLVVALASLAVVGLGALTAVFAPNLIYDRINSFEDEGATQNA